MPGTGISNVSLTARCDRIGTCDNRPDGRELDYGCEHGRDRNEHHRNEHHRHEHHRHEHDREAIEETSTTWPRQQGTHPRRSVLQGSA